MAQNTKSISLSIAGSLLAVPKHQSCNSAAVRFFSLILQHVMSFSHVQESTKGRVGIMRRNRFLSGSHTHVIIRLPLKERMAPYCPVSRRALLLRFDSSTRTQIFIFLLSFPPLEHHHLLRLALKRNQDVHTAVVVLRTCRYPVHFIFV